MKKYTLIYVILSVTLILPSCSKDAKKAEAEKIVAEWTGKTVVFPEGIPCSSMGRDTLCPRINNADYRILLYTDSTG